MIDASIMHAFESVTKLGGYIILFSILASLGGASHCSRACTIGDFSPDSRK